MPFTIPEYCCCGLEQSLERDVDLLNLVFLHKTKDHINYDDRHDDGKVTVFPGHQGYQGSHQDNIHQGTFDLVEQDDPNRCPFLLGQAVLAMLLARR